MQDTPLISTGMPSFGMSVLFFQNQSEKCCNGNLEEATKTPVLPFEKLMPLCEAPSIDFQIRRTASSVDKLRTTTTASRSPEDKASNLSDTAASSDGT